MVLTPDQKKRIAALDVEPAEPEKESAPRSSVLTAKAKAATLRARASSFQNVVAKLLVALAIIGVAAYFIVVNQLHRIDFKSVFSSGRGSPMVRLSNAVKVQRKKVELLKAAQGHLMVGEHQEAFQKALEIQKLDSKDSQADVLIDNTVDSVTLKAAREFETGEIVAALSDVRLALKYRVDHSTANNLYGDIADRLYLEAEEHYRKREYAKLITKAQEVVKIGKSPSNMAAYNLLNKTNNELLADAEELFASRRYFESLGNVRLSLRIDETNPGALSLFSKISDYVETPNLVLRGIIKIRGTFHARIELPDSGDVKFVKEGETLRNFKVIAIDARQKEVSLKQIYTGQVFKIRQTKPE